VPPISIARVCSGWAAGSLMCRSSVRLWAHGARASTAKAAVELVPSPTTMPAIPRPARPPPPTPRASARRDRHRLGMLPRS